MALLQLRIESDDTVLAQHIQSADTHHNALYTSKNIQNELIVACGHIIHTSILKDIKAAHLFSVMADEATGVANDEQLSISLRYVQHDMRTMAFSECVTRVSGESIADHILHHFVKIGSFQPPTYI